MPADPIPGPEAGAAAIRAGDSIRAVLARHPQTAPVFEQYGLMGCGGPAGPDEPIERFAELHRIDASRLLAALNQALREPVATPARAVPAPAPVFTPFLRTALWSTLTLGATFGAANLVEIDFALGRVPEAHNWIHAGAQLWGFVLFAIMGVAYHALPRLLGTELGAPRLARASFWLALAALVAGTWGRFTEVVPGAVGATALGALLSLAALVSFAWVLHATREAAGGRRETFHRFLEAGTLWWLAGAGLLAVAALRVWSHASVAAGARWNDAVYAALLFGGSLGWIQGMFLRTGPGFLSLEPPRRGWLGPALWLGQAGTALLVFGAASLGRPRAQPLEGAGFLLLALGAVSYVAALRPFRSRSRELGPDDRRLLRNVTVAFLFLLLFALLSGGYGLAEILGRTPSRLIFDAARHAFALGFTTLFILAMGGRILPVFGGSPLAWPRLHDLGTGLVALGAALRQAQVVVALASAPVFLKVAGVSGVLGALGVILAAGSLLRTIGQGARASRPATGPAPLAADTIVADLVAAHPEALPLLVQAGFTPLANPVLRSTLARAVTLGQACRMHGIDVGAILARLREACPHGTPAPGATPPAHAAGSTGPRTVSYLGKRRVDR